MEWNENFGTVWKMEDAGNRMEDNLPYFQNNSIISKKRSSFCVKCVQILIFRKNISWRRVPSYATA